MPDMTCTDQMYDAFKAAAFGEDSDRETMADTMKNGIEAALKVSEMGREYPHLDRAYLEQIDQITALQRKVIVLELAAKGQGLDENDIPYDLPKEPTLSIISCPEESLVVAKGFLTRMYEAMEPRFKLPPHLYGSTLGEEARALLGRKEY